MFSLEQLHTMLDKATYVRVIRKNIYVWHGGGYVNVYDSEGRCVSCFGIATMEHDYVDSVIERQANDGS